MLAQRPSPPHPEARGTRGTNGKPIHPTHLVAKKAAKSRAEARSAGIHEVAALDSITEGLTPSDDDIAPVLFENLGLALLNQGRSEDAVQAFRRAIEGDVATRAQAGRFLVRLLFQLGHTTEAQRLLARWEALHGPHPDRAT